HDIGQTPRQMMGGVRIFTGDVGQRHLGEGVDVIVNLRHGSSSTRDFHFTRTKTTATGEPQPTGGDSLRLGWIWPGPSPDESHKKGRTSNGADPRSIRPDGR